MADKPAFSQSRWHSASGGGNCVEIAHENGWFGMRDSKSRGHGPVLVFSADEWREFVEDFKGGRFGTPER